MNAATESRNDGLGILVVDDCPIARTLLDVGFSSRGCVPVVAGSGLEALATLRGFRPDVILMDVCMPDMDGYETLAAVRQDPRLETTPVVFLTASPSDIDRGRAFALGALDYQAKPLDVDWFLRAVRAQLLRLDRSAQRNALRPHVAARSLREFVEAVVARSGFLADGPLPTQLTELYGWARDHGIREHNLAQMAAEFLGHPFLDHIDPESLALGALSRAYCMKHKAVPVRVGTGEIGLVVANPFDTTLIAEIARWTSPQQGLRLFVASPRTILATMDFENVEGRPSRAARPAAAPAGARKGTSLAAGVSANTPAGRFANILLERSVRQGASDIHLENKESDVLVRCRIDGILHEVERIDKDEGSRLLSRFKALAGMDIAEKRKPQDGALEATIDGRSFKLRLATSSGPNGEGMVIRLLEPEKQPPWLTDLGMREDQAETIRAMSSRQQGLILFVGPTGSGKSTSIYSMLSHIDISRRKLLTVENPVEYRIPMADQQQVNEVAGVTFEALLRGAVRQDPDILFLGEIRDAFSAKAAMDFASSGHLTVSTIHSANATTAIFRLERLGLSRGAISEALRCVVAQKLLPRLCAHCKTTRPPTAWERAVMAPYAEGSLPEQVAEPRGCMACRQTGYRGREGVYEVIEFDAALTAMVREGAAVFALRQALRERGAFLASQHGMQKIRSLDFAVQDVADAVMVDDRMFFEEPAPGAGSAPARPHAAGCAECDHDAPAAGPSAVRADVSVPLPFRDPVVAGPAACEPEADAAPWPGNEWATEAAPEDEWATGTAAATGDAGPPESRLLVVEDDADTRALFEHVLSRAGYHVTAVGDGAEALVKLGAEQFRAILSDIDMPVMDGMTLLDTVKDSGITSPVILVSGLDQEAAEARGLRHGAADFIRKPVDRDVLLMRLSRVLGVPWVD